MPTIITMDNVYRIFRMGQERIYAVNGISLTLRRGDLLPAGTVRFGKIHAAAYDGGPG